MRSAILPIFTLVSLGAAQSSSVVSLLIGERGGSRENLVGSIAGSDASATTYIINCDSTSGTATPTVSGGDVTILTGAAASSTGTDDRIGDQDSDDNDNDVGPGDEDDQDDGPNDDDFTQCAFDGTQTIIQGPSTVHFEVSYGSATQTIDCKLDGTTSATCAGTQGGADIASETSLANNIAETVTFNSGELPFAAVTITAGGSGGGDNGGSSSSMTGSMTGSTTASGGSGTSTGTAAAASSTGGAAGMLMEPALGMVVAGAAAVGLAAMIL